METKSVTCKRCGEENLRWKQFKKGKWYLTPMEPAKIRNENHRVIKTIDFAHNCEETLKQRRNWERDAMVQKFRTDFLAQNPEWKYNTGSYYPKWIEQTIAVLGNWE